MDSRKPTTRFVPVPGHPGIAKRDGQYVVRSPFRKGRDSTFRTLKEALHEQGLRRSGATSILTEPFCDYAPKWITTYRGRRAGGIDPDTRESYRDIIERIAVPYFKRKPIGKIAKPMVRDFIGHLFDHGYSAATVRRFIAPLRAMFAELDEDGAISGNPATVRIVSPELPQRRRKIIAPDAVQAIVAEIPAALVDMIMLLAMTGVRISEACGLQWGDLGHDEHGHPAVTIERQHRNGKYKPRPKTTAGNRTIRIPAALSRRLTKRRAELGVAALSTSPLFATRNGTPYDRHNVARKLRAACDDAGVERISPHVLRHSIGSLLYERGWTDVQIAAFLGHEDPAFTKRTYLHAVDGGDVSALGELFGLAEGE